MARSKKMDFLAKFGGAKQLDDVIHYGDWSNSMKALLSPHVTKEHLDKILLSPTSNYSPGVRQRAVAHPLATADHLLKGLEDEDYGVRTSVFRDFGFNPRNHPAITPEMVMRGMKDSDAYVRMSAMKHPLADHHHVRDVMVNDPEPTIREVAQQYKEGKR